MSDTDKLAEALRKIKAYPHGNFGHENVLRSIAAQALAAYEAEAKPAPAEPTLEMLKAGAAEWLKYGEREACYPLAQGFDKLTPEDAIRRSRLTHVYRAMLAAAPAAPAADRVYIPTSAEQAAGMVSVAMAWLKEHAPDRLAAPAAPAPAELACDIQPRPLAYSLADYHRAMSEGPLHYTWQDKPHRLVYDLIAAVRYYAAPAAPAPCWTPEQVAKAQEIAAELKAKVQVKSEAAPAAPAMPNPGSPEASAMIDSVLAEYNWPSNTKNAARAGYVAATRLMAAPAAPAESPLQALTEACEDEQNAIDAERYRWLRDQWDRSGVLERVMLSDSADGKSWVGGGVLDQRIDAAIAASTGKGGAA